MLKIGLLICFLLFFFVSHAARAQVQPTSPVVVFWEEEFPAADTVAPSRAELAALLPQAFYAGAEQLGEALTRETTRLLVLPFGSAFPEDGWEAIYDFLERGGNLLVLGGQPFTRAAYRQEGRWKLRPARIAFAKQLFINEYQPTPGSTGLAFRVNEDHVFLDLPAFNWTRAFSLMVRLADEEHYSRHGATGTLDARLDALVWGEAEGRRLSAPLVQIDHLKNNFVGGRWIFLACELPQGFFSTAPARGLVPRLVAQALAGAEEFVLQPTWPLFLPGEPVGFHLRWRRFGADPAPARLELDVSFPDGTARQKALDLTPGQFPYFTRIEWPPSAQKGLHVVTARLYDDGGLRRIFRTGFWLRDEEFLNSGPRVTVNDDFFELDGRPLPVVGTTYMASDVQRQFFMSPNVYIWDRDFAELRRAGINMLRTGWWTAWEQVMKEPGVIHEEMLRALEAFLLTARKHALPVQFTFFSFIPEVLGGGNPYLDPEALRRQKDLVLAVVERFKDVPYLIWDLINEPSFSNPQRLWVTRPNGDKQEQNAWNSWLNERYPDRGALAAAWNTTLPSPRAPLPLPEERDFSVRNFYQGRKPLKVNDYYLFAQEQFARWAASLRDAIRATGSRQLVTVGQDEGGLRDRPSPAYFAKAVDFIAMHNWWLNDALLWDSLAARQPGLPMLVQETGVMHQEEIDETPRRDSANKAALLERKLALSLATGAGAIQWLWHVNAYMRDDNEVSIGAVRVDGTEKPEADVLRRMARFAAAARDAFRRPEASEVTIVTSQAFQYSVFNWLAIEAQMKAVRALHYHCGMPGSVLAENQIERLGNPRLVILPSPHALSERAWQALLKYVSAGGSLLVTGSIECDRNWQRTGRLTALQLAAELEAVTYRQAFLRLGTETVAVAFDGQKQEFVEAVRFADGQSFRELPWGQGRIFLASYPVELAEGLEAAAALYAWVLRRLELKPPVSGKMPSAGILVRPVVFADAVLYLFLSESAEDEEIELRDRHTGAELRFRLPAQRAALVLLRRADGQVLARYGF